MKRIFTEGHWSPYSGKAVEYVHKIQDNVDAVHTNQWILNPRYGFAWMEDNRGWVSVMKPKVFKVAGEKRYGYQVYGLSKDGTLRDKSSNWWDTPEEAQENIKRIFKIDMAQESTRGNTKMKRRIIKERSFSSDEESLINQALEAAIKAKSLLDDAADTIRDAVGETFLFARLDSHSMDLDDTIDDIKGVLNGTVDATDDEYVPESRKRFGNKFVRESDGEAGGNWSQYGEYTKPLPGDCIKDCASPGQRDSEVAMWVEELDFANGMPIEKAKNYIEEYGAWDREELDEKSDEEIAQIVLWIFAGNVHEEAYMFLRDGCKEDYPDLEELPDDVSDWTDEDWEAFQNVYCSLSLSN